MPASPRRLVGALVATAAAFTVGLVSTPAAAAQPLDEATRAAVAVSTPTAASAFRVYVPHGGDTLWRIAARFCGRGSLYPRLAAASGIVNPDRIYAGRTRVVLACAGAATGAPISYQPTYRGTARDKRIAAVTGFAKAQVGKWYRYGTAGPRTYDCSGLTMASYSKIGVRLLRSARQQSTNGRAVSLYHLLPGDVVWHRGYPYWHVALYIGGGLIVEAPHTGARLRIRSLRVGEWNGARRII